MIEESAAHYEIYLTKQGQNALTKHQVIAFLQLLRMINALRFQMSLLLHTRDEKDGLFRLRSQLEIYAILASTFKESVKEFYNHLFKTLGPLSDKEEVKEALTEYDKKTKNFKDDEVLNIIDYIRHNFSFHIKSNLFQNYVIEGDAKEDMLIGVAKSEKVIDQCFLKAYDALIFQICEMAKSVTDKSKIIDWLFDNILRETDYFCDLLDKLGGSIIKKYGGKKLAGEQWGSPAVAKDETL
jgi:hypothetical protein